MTKLLLVTLALVVAGLAHAQDAASQGDMGVQLKSATDSLAAAEYEVSRLNQALGQEKSRVLGSDVERHLNRTTISLLERDHAQAQVDLLEKRKNFKAVKERNDQVVAAANRRSEEQRQQQREAEVEVVPVV